MTIRETENNASSGFYYVPSKKCAIYSSVSERKRMTTL